MGRSRHPRSPTITLAEDASHTFVRADFEKWRRVAREGNIVVE